MDRPVLVAPTKRPSFHSLPALAPRSGKVYPERLRAPPGEVVPLAFEAAHHDSSTEWLDGDTYVLCKLLVCATLEVLVVCQWYYHRASCSTSRTSESRVAHAV
jgi:hypothetical protein